MPALHEFFTDNHDALLALCVRKLRERSPERPEAELAEHLDAFLDEVIRALRREAGLRDSSPLPGWSDTAAKLGEKRQRDGLDITKVSAVFGVISQSLGEIGGQQGLSFTAKEYGIFNHCVDDGIATAIERYATEAQAQHESQSTERVGALAHELRNALSSAKMAYAILKQGQVGIESRTGQVLGRALRRMEHLVDQTVLAVRLQGGHSVQMNRVRVDRLVEELCDSAVVERGVEIDVDIEKNIQVDGDERLLASAIGNLLQNALKFTRAGGRVQLRARAVGEEMIIEVEDECGGLPANAERELFLPFVQRASDKRGMGLGLTITREAVEALGGSISVRDLPGKGCVFTIRIGRTALRPPAVGGS